VAPLTSEDRPAEAGKRQAAQVRVTVDTSEAPELAGWGRRAADLVRKWHPIISEMLRSDGFTPPTEIRIVFKKATRAIAFTSASTITIGADWVKKHPGDYGMVVHELTHTIQRYRGGAPGWLVEGIADYVRFFHYEPQTRLRLDPARASYRHGYREAAMFLAWLERTHHRDIVRKLNEALRHGTYSDDLFKTWTSKTLDQLWGAYVASVERK
jgi:hypothetical protein